MSKLYELLSLYESLTIAVKIEEQRNAKETAMKQYKCDMENRLQETRKQIDKEVERILKIETSQKETADDLHRKVEKYVDDFYKFNKSAYGTEEMQNKTK